MKNIKTVAEETKKFIKSLDLIIENCKNYDTRSNLSFEKTKEYMKKNNPELFNNEDSEDNIVFDFCEIKANEKNQAENLKWLISNNK